MKHKSNKQNLFSTLLSYVKSYKSISNREQYFVPLIYEGWNFNSGNYLFTTDTK